MYWPIGAPRVYALSNQEALSENNGTVRASDHSPSDEPTDDDARDALETPQQPAQREDPEAPADDAIVASKVSRGGGIFASITSNSLTVWQTKPVVALASVVRSQQSLEAYGPNRALLLRPDGVTVVIQTSQGYLINYAISVEPNALVYRTLLPNSSAHGHKRHASGDGPTTYRRPSAVNIDAAAGERDGIREVSISFRMVVRIDAGISYALALDDELVVATQRPAAIQCVRWATETGVQQTSTELLSRMSWMNGKKSAVVEMVHDRPMNLSTWITADGCAYAVQRRSVGASDAVDSPSLFRGYCFREPETDDGVAVKTAINARFSLIAVACADGTIDIYGVKDYLGNIPLSHRVSSPVSQKTSGQVTFISYSPDGYCLLVGYEKGWALWSVYGKAGASSFGHDHVLSERNNELYLQGVKDGSWLGGGCELLLVAQRDSRFFVLDMFRSAATSCLSPSNTARGLLQGSGSLMLYKGHEVLDLTALSADVSLWQTVQIPSAYLAAQWPIKATVSSPDGKYVAIAGRRGLAHYSCTSGRWKTFDDPAAEDEFAVRGGMCWFRHVLIAAIEADNKYQIRLYLRDKTLSYSHIQHTEELVAPAVHIGTSGEDSVLVYTYENTLLHYIVTFDSAGTVPKLVRVGQIGFHGIIRAPPRVRSISWILPEEQLEYGDPSQDVATASVLFLVDGKMVLLQPSTNDAGELKYDMRVIAQNVETYMLLRDHPGTLAMSPSPGDMSVSQDMSVKSDNHLGHGLRDSLWFFDGINSHLWPDVHDVLACAPSELGRDLPSTVQVPLDFYPLSPLVPQGVIHGLDSELVQRRDINFSMYRISARTQLFLPHALRSHLAEYNSPAALHLASAYQHLSYFAHALEILLHDVLDAEVDHPPDPPETALLPTVLVFLSSFPSYLDVIVNCTRKTELRSWRTLFESLPPVLSLFEEALAKGKSKTAAGYLLVLHALESEGEGGLQTREFARLLRQAANEEDWELCRELARFLMGIDGSGDTLRAVKEEANLGGGAMREQSNVSPVTTSGRSYSRRWIGATNGNGRDYFSFGSLANGANQEDNLDEQFGTPGE
ncbi:hypothetical protein MBLNU230_g4456t1 [Neophaeotheca triangularis]